MADDIVPKRGKSIFEQGAEGRSIISEIFDGKPVRGINSGNTVWTYSKDVGDAAGLDQPHVSKIIKRIRLTNPEYLLDATMASIGISDPKLAKHKIILISSEGISLFFNGIDVDRLLPDRRENVLRFHIFMMNLVSSTISGETERATIEALKNAGLPVADTWQEQRSLSKIAHNMLMDTLKETYMKKYAPNPVPRHIYSNENKMLNKVSYGHHEKAIREKYKTDLPATALLTINSISDRAYARMGQDYHARKNLLEEDTAQYHALISGEKKVLKREKQALLSGF